MTVDCMYREQAGRATRIQLNRFHALHPDGQRLVRGWFEKAHAAMTTDDECFEAFIFAWFAVNGWAACVTGNDRDADYIRALQRSAELAEKFQTLLDGNPQFQSAAADFQRFWPIFKAQDIRRAGRRAPAAADRPAVVQHYFDGDLRVFEPQCWKSHTDAGEDVSLDWPQTLAAIYRVRCNLFHGEKSAHSEMDREIVCTALVVLVMFFRHSQIL
jgi:hypothetical protein